MKKQKDSQYLPTRDSTGFLVRSLYQSFNRLVAQRIAHANLTTAQWYFLRVLWEQEGVAQRQLSESVGLTESTTVTALKIMEKRGLIKRRRDPDDSRRIIVSLTRKGRKLEMDLLPDVQAINHIAHTGMTSREVRALQKQLRKMEVELDRELDKDT